jgi:hypothetical protein
MLSVPSLGRNGAEKISNAGLNASGFLKKIDWATKTQRKEV